MCKNIHIWVFVRMKKDHIEPVGFSTPPVLWLSIGSWGKVTIGSCGNIIVNSRDGVTHSRIVSILQISYFRQSLWSFRHFCGADGLVKDMILHILRKVCFKSWKKNMEMEKKSYEYNTSIIHLYSKVHNKKNEKFPFTILEINTTI